MKSSYAVGLAIVAFSLGIVFGLRSGAEGSDDSWRRAVMSTDEACRYAVRDALKNGPFVKE